MPQYKITLGDRSFEFTGPLKFRQLRIVEPAIARVDRMRRELHASGEPFNEKFYDEIASVILAVVNSKDAPFTREDLNETPVTPDDLLAAYKQVCMASGLWKSDANPEAEGKAASPNPQSPLTGA